MILVIDNYDSFTYNLVQYLGELGADLPVAREIEVARNDRITIEEIEGLAPERIVLSPGPCTPDEAGITLDVISPEKSRFSASVWAIRRWARRSAGASFAPPT
jgi:anthranilate synthase component 2